MQVPGDSLAAKAGLRPTSRGFAGNIVLGDIIVAVDDKPVSFCLFSSFSLFVLEERTKFLLFLLRTEILIV